jgi:hypothetical protein
MTATTSRAGFAVAYDLREPGAWQRALRHRDLWGKLYTDGFYLDPDHIVLVFRPAPSKPERWRAWERVRARWILGELPA